jgi:hypothetical protein
VSPPRVRGSLADRPAAAALAREVQRVHLRYAIEVVATFRLCPFLRDPETAFGDFVVVLDRELDLDRAEAAALEVESSVVHLVFPCLAAPHRVFERFAGDLLARIRARVDAPPVSAVFHPEMPGDRATPYRLVGLLRRAPDPFVQLVPEGLHEGGTVFAGAEAAPEDRAEASFARLAGEIDRIEVILAEIRRDRDASYAPLLAALAA